MRKMTSRNAQTRATASAGRVTNGYSNRPRSLARSGRKLTSGESLAEFALRFGFLAPRLLGFAGPRVAHALRFPEAR